MRYFLFVFLLTLVGVSTSYAETAPSSPIGYWKTIDDISGKPKSIVKISENTDGSLTGQVIKIFPKDGEDSNKVCTACKGDRHNQPILGMVIMKGLKLNESQWEKGSILDPGNGKIYQCALRPVDKGKKLHVRGYIGLPLLGRSQTWLRVNSHELA